VATVTIKVLRSPQRDRWVGGITALVVLAWTSEGLWEVAYFTLELPLGFAVMTFFVYEAMMLTSAMQAERNGALEVCPGLTMMGQMSSTPWGLSSPAHAANL
jgi:hypothetical protein